MVETIEGIVIKASDYQEKSKIIQVFTKEHGLIGIYLKGGNHYKSKTFALAQPISHAFFNILYTKGLSSCFVGEMIHSFRSLKIDFHKNIYIYHLFELIYKNIEQHQSIPYLYDLILNIMKEINDTDNTKKTKIMTLFFELKLLYFIGVAPILSHCVECGDQENIANFDISKGGFVCNQCIDDKSGHYSIESLKFLYQLFHQEFTSLQYEIDEKIITELRDLVTNYYAYHLNMKTNSSKYFDCS